MAVAYVWIILALNLIGFDEILRGVAGDPTKQDVNLQCRTLTGASSGSGRNPLQADGKAFYYTKSLGTGLNVVMAFDDLENVPDCQNFQREDLFPSSSNGPADEQTSDEYIVFIGESACQGNLSKMVRITKLVNYMENSGSEPAASIKSRVWFALGCDVECQTEKGF